MPTGGAEMAIGDGAALMGADPRPELRRAIENAARELKAADQVGHTYDWYVLEGAIDVAVLRESRAREVRDEALGKLEAEVEDLKHELRSKREDYDRVKVALQPLFPNEPEHARAGWLAELTAERISDVLALLDDHGADNRSQIRAALSGVQQSPGDPQ